MNPNLSGSYQDRQAGFFRWPIIQSINQPISRAQQQGFSLIEILIVMVIISVMATVAIPAFSDWRGRQAVSNAAQALLANMKQARVLAVAENRSVRISFTSTSYTFDANTTGNCGACRNESSNLSQFGSNLSVSPTTTRTFSSRGTSNSGTVTLTSGSHTKKITMNVIGRAYLQ